MTFSVLNCSADIHPVVVFVAEALVRLQNLVESRLDAVLAAAQGVAVIVQQAVHVGALHHLHQDGRQLALQRKQALPGRNNAAPPHKLAAGTFCSSDGGDCKP